MTESESEGTENRTIFRRAKDKENPFVMIDRTIFDDEVVSWKAKGLLGYLLSKPDDWIVRMGDLVKHASDGRHATASAVRELEEHGYLTRCQEHDEQGHFAQLIIEVHEVPVPPERRTKPQKRERRPQTGFPLTVKPLTDEPLTENPSITNTDSTETNCTKNIPPAPNISPETIRQAEPSPDVAPETAPLRRADPLALDLERDTAANHEANYAVPSQAGGDDALIDTAITLLCGGHAPKRKSGTYKDMANVIGEVHVAFGLVEQEKPLDIVRTAVELFIAEKPQMTVYKYPSFAANYYQYLGRAANGEKGAQQHGNTHQPAIAKGAVPRRVATEAEARAILGDRYRGK